MNRLKNFTLFTFIFLCISCSKKSKLEVLLTDKSKKWVYIHYYTFNRNSKIMAYIEFDKNNICQNIYSNGERFDSPGEWEYNERDSSLIIYKNKFKFKQIIGDSIYVFDEGEKYNALLINLANTNYLSADD